MAAGGGATYALPYSLTLEQLIIALVRVGGSLPVLRWAFAGALIAIAVDLSDLWLMGYIRLGGVGDYQSFDKWLDLVYMGTFLWVAARQWDGLHRRVAVGLFALRMVGIAGFEVTDDRVWLLAFPNVFEFWFVGAAAQRHWWGDYELTWRRALGWLALCAVLKVVHEYVLHGWRVLDEFSAVDLTRDALDLIVSPF